MAVAAPLPLSRSRRWGRAPLPAPSPRALCAPNQNRATIWRRRPQHRETAPRALTGMRRAPMGAGAGVGGGVGGARAVRGRRLRRLRPQGGARAGAGAGHRPKTGTPAGRHRDSGTPGRPGNTQRLLPALPPTLRLARRQRREREKRRWRVGGLPAWKASRV